MDGQGIFLPRASRLLNPAHPPPQESVIGASWGLFGMSWGCLGGRFPCVGVFCWIKSIIFVVGFHLLVSFLERNPLLLGSAPICLGRLPSKIYIFWCRLPFVGVVGWKKYIRFQENWNPFEFLRWLVCFTFEWLDAYRFVDSVLRSVISTMSSIESLGLGCGVTLLSNNVFGMVSFSFQSVELVLDSWGQWSRLRLYVSTLRAIITKFVCWTHSY